MSATATASPPPQGEANGANKEVYPESSGASEGTAGGHDEDHDVAATSSKEHPEEKENASEDLEAKGGATAPGNAPPASTTTGNDASQGPPDGGLAAWTVVFGGFVTLFMSFGFLNGFAAFQAYYFENTLKGYSNSDIAWIGALQVFAILSSNLVIGPLFDRYGPRPLLIAAMLLFSFGAMMTSLAHKYYQIILAQGVVIGWGLGCAFITPMACTMQWFDKKRPAALGVVIGGSSIGGVVWPIITYQLLQHVGFGWTWRAIGFIGLGLLAIPVLTVRMPPYAVAAKAKRGPAARLDLDAFKAPMYNLFIFMYIFFALGLFPLLFYFPELAGRWGVGESMQFYTISILNAFSFLGRAGLPFLAPKLGVWNLSAFIVFATGLVSFTCMAIDSGAGTIVAAGAFGFTSGGSLSLVIAAIPGCIPNFQKLGAAMGQIFFLASFAGLLSGPIAGWIIGPKIDGNWIPLEGFVGGCLFIAAGFLLYMRYRKQPDWRKAC